MERTVLFCQPQTTPLHLNYINYKLESLVAQMWLFRKKGDAYSSPKQAVGCSVLLL